MESSKLRWLTIAFFLVLRGVENCAELTDCIDTPGGSQYSSGGSHSSYHSSGSSSSSSSQFGESGSAHSSLFPTHPVIPIISPDPHGIVHPSLSSGSIASTFQQLKQKADQFVEKGSGSVGIVHTGWGGAIGSEGFSSDIESHNVLGSGKFVNSGSQYQQQQSNVDLNYAPSPVAGYGYHAEDRYSGQTYNQALTAPRVVSETKESETLNKNKFVKVQSIVPQQVQEETHIGQDSLTFGTSLPSSKLYQESHAYQEGSSGYSQPVEVFSPSLTQEKTYVKTSGKESTLTKPGTITDVKYVHGESLGSSSIDSTTYTKPIVASSETGAPTKVGSISVTVKKTEEVIPSYVHQPAQSFSDSHQTGYSQIKTSETAPITYSKVVYPSYVTSEKKSSSISEKTSQSSGLPVHPISGGYQTGYSQIKTSETIPTTYTKIVYPSYVTGGKSSSYIEKQSQTSGQSSIQPISGGYQTGYSEIKTSETIPSTYSKVVYPSYAIEEKKSSAVSETGSHTSGAVVVPGSLSSSGYYSRDGYYEKSSGVKEIEGQYPGVSGQSFIPSGAHHTGTAGTYVIDVAPSGQYTQYGSQTGGTQYSQSSGVAGVPLVYTGGERYTSGSHSSGSKYSTSSGSHLSGSQYSSSHEGLGSGITDALCSGCVGSYQVGSQPSKKTYGVSSSWSSSSRDINGQKTESRQASVTVNDNGKIDTYERHTKK